MSLYMNEFASFVKGPCHNEFISFTNGPCHNETGVNGVLAVSRALGDAELKALVPAQVETWLLNMWNDLFTCDMCHLYSAWTDLQTQSWKHLSKRRDVTLLYVTWLFDMWHDSFIFGMVHLETQSWRCGPSTGRDMTHLYVKWLLHVWHDAFIFGLAHLETQSWRLLSQHRSLYFGWIREKTRSYVTWFIIMWHDPFMCDMADWYVTWFIHEWILSHMNE